MEIKLKVFSNDDLEVQCQNILDTLRWGANYKDIAESFNRTPKQVNKLQEQVKEALNKDFLKAQEGNLIKIPREAVIKELNSSQIKEVRT